MSHLGIDNLLLTSHNPSPTYIILEIITNNDTVLCIFYMKSDGRNTMYRDFSTLLLAHYIKI